MSKKNNIPDENDDLNGMNNNNPFKASNDYFENFTSKLNARIDNLEEITPIAPILSSIPKYNPFEVPKEYFDELPSRIQEQTIRHKPASALSDWLMMVIKPRVLIPLFSIALIAFAGIRYMNNNAQLPVKQVAEEISVEEQLYNIDESTIIEKLTADANTENESVSTDDNSIENYLLDNNVDESNLNNEL